MCICAFTNKTGFFPEKHTKDGCEGEKTFVQLKTVLYIFVYLCASKQNHSLIQGVTLSFLIFRESTRWRHKTNKLISRIKILLRYLYWISDAI
jgi:hypothetical protein